MSYDIRLKDAKTDRTLCVETPHNIRGGTYCVGGIDALTLNITYNYAETFCRLLGDNGIRSIYGKTGLESIPV